MRKFSTINLKDDEIEVSKDLIETYKKNTNKKRITKKGMENYFNTLIEKMKTFPSYFC
jgi:hypothetical protein